MHDNLRRELSLYLEEEGLESFLRLVKNALNDSNEDETADLIADIIVALE